MGKGPLEIKGGPALKYGLYCTQKKIYVYSLASLAINLGSIGGQTNCFTGGIQRCTHPWKVWEWCCDHLLVLYDYMHIISIVRNHIIKARNRVSSRLQPLDDRKFLAPGFHDVLLFIFCTLRGLQSNKTFGLRSSPAATERLMDYPALPPFPFFRDQI